MNFLLNLRVPSLFARYVFCNSLVGKLEDFIVVVGACLTGKGLSVCRFEL